MGLACSQMRLLTLTRRKADCEYGISINSMEKMSLTKEMTQLSQDYYSKLHAKNVTFYANGKYNKINYNYLMGYGDYSAILNGDRPLKTDNKMILTDFKGQVVLSDSYANAIKSVLGSSIMDRDGRGGTFSTDKIPEILAVVCPGTTAEKFRNGINHSQFSATTKNTMTGETTGTTVVNNTDTVNSLIDKLIDFYYPIFQAAAANGWSAEYNEQITENPDYVSDAITSGTFQLSGINDNGQYDENTSLTYYVTSGAIDVRNDSEQREEITAWYNAEKNRISEKETLIDVDMENLSTELNAINTEIQSIQSYINDAVQSVFNWGNA